jgi:N-acyl-L-homoserine lactone synthetase
MAPSHQASSKHAALFFQSVAQIARSRGARMLVTVSPVSMERLLRINGINAQRIGRPVKYHQTPITSLAIELNL